MRAYASDWHAFTKWCENNGYRSLPADPAVVILYITALSHRLKASSITRRMSAISIAHQQAMQPTPTSDVRVRDVMRGIRRTLGTATDEAAPATIGDIRKMVYGLPDTTIARRDRAVLLVGFAGALRRSEIVALDVADIERRDEGMAVLVRRSKTDQEAKGQHIALPFGHDPQTCPVRALDEWLQTAQITDGPIFRAVDRHGNIGVDRLSDQSVALIVKRAAQRAGFDPARFSGHSLRAGFATSAAAAGANERAIANQTGHKSMNVLRGYIRHGSLFVDNAVTSIGI